MTLFQHLPTQLQTLKTWGTALNPINALMTTGEIKKTAPSPQPSTNLQGKKIQISSLNTSHWKYTNTPKDRFQYHWTLIQYIWYTEVNKQQKKAWKNILEDILDHTNQSIEAKNYEDEPAPLSRHSTNLQGKKIRISILDTAHRQLANAPEDTLQDQWTLIWSLRTKKSTINGANIITKNPNNNTWRIIDQINIRYLYRLNWCSINQEH